MSNLSWLITSRVMDKLLYFFIVDYTELIHYRALCREIKEDIGASHRYLNKLVESGLVIKKIKGQNSFYYPNTQHLCYKPLREILTKDMKDTNAI